MKTRTETIVAITLLVFTACAADQVLAQSNRQNNLFSQYYTQPGASTTNAEMYPAPHPVPRHVGHSYYTYQPLMPHELMYGHQRDYYRYYATPETFYCNQCGGPQYRPGYGLTKTTVRWQSGCNSVAPLPGTTFPLMRLNNFWSRKHSVPKPKTGLKGRLGRYGCFGKGGLAGRFGHGSSDYAEVDCMEGCSDGYGYGWGEYGGTCGTCENKSNKWARARQQAVAKTAQAMSGRNVR